MSLMANSNPIAIGIIIAAVAVLLTQPEHSVVTSPSANRMRVGLEPTHFIERIA